MGNIKEFDRIRELIMKMASLVEGSFIELFVLKEKPQDLEEKLETNEDKINLLHKEIDDACFKYIALYHPVAKNLRIVLAATKINSELERMGDQIINMKRSVRQFSLQELEYLTEMATAVSKMLKMTFDSIVMEDTALAQEVIYFDKKVNEMDRQNIKKCLEKFGKIDGNKLYQATRLTKCLERVGDHATNIAEDVIFAHLGEDIRHFKTPQP